MVYSPDNKMPVTELEQRMTPDNYIKYNLLSSIINKISYGKIKEINSDDWDLIKGLLFANSTKTLELPTDTQDSLMLAGNGEEKVEEAKKINQQIRLKLGALTGAIANFKPEDESYLEPKIVEAINTISQYAKNPRINMPNEVREKIIKHGIASIIAKLSDTSNPKILGNKLSVLDLNIIDSFLEEEIRKILPEPTDAKTLTELEHYFFKNRGEHGPM